MEGARLHKVLTDGGVRLGAVVSDLHGAIGSSNDQGQHRPNSRTREMRLRCCKRCPASI